MTQQAKLRGLGLAPAVAGQIVGDQAGGYGLVAAGATQATATNAYSDVNVVTTVAAATGVILPPQREVGDTVEVTNLGANSLSVYPPLGGNIGTGAANAAFAVPVSKTAIFRLVAISAAGVQQWTSLLSA